MENQNVNMYVKGMMQDLSPIQTPKESYWFALNAVNESKKGELDALSTEEGNRIVHSLPANSCLLAAAHDNDGGFYLFIKEPTAGVIAHLDRKDVYKDIIRSQCFNFKCCSTLSAEFREIDGCEPTLYFADNLNGDKRINIAQIEDYIIFDNIDFTDAGIPLVTEKKLRSAFNAKTLTEAQREQLRQLANDYDAWNCNTMLFVQNFSYPKASIDIRNNGGILEVGAYQIVLQYLDKDLNGNDYVSLPQVVYVHDDAIGAPVSEVDGAEAGTVTTKSLEVSISDLDPSYAYVRVIAIHTKNGVKTAYVSQDKLIGGNPNATAIVTGRWDTTVPIEEIVTPLVKYKTSQHIKQKDNRLIRFGVKEDIIDWYKFQKQVHANVTVNWVAVSHALNNSSVNQTSPVYTKGYMRDEVYAFAAVPVLKDGTYGPALHIKGRKKNITRDGITISDVSNGSHNRPNASPGSWDSTKDGDVSVWNNLDYKPLVEQGEIASDLERWQVYNTAYITEWVTDNSDLPGGRPYRGELAYHESKDFTYPQITDCDGDSVFGDDSGKPIRHHRMPDATLVPHVGEGAFSYPYAYPLGVEINGLSAAIPAEYADKFQGWLIVRAKIDPLNQSVLSKGYYWNVTTEDDKFKPNTESWGSAVYSPDVGEYWSNETTFDRLRLQDAHFVKFENRVQQQRSRYTLQPLTRCLDSNIPYSYVSIQHDFSSPPIAINRIFSETAYVPNNSSLSTAIPFSKGFNNTRSTATFAVEFPENEGPEPFTLVAPFADVIYSAFKKYNPNAYGDLTDLVYYQCSDNITKPGDEFFGYLRVFGGDTFITELNFRRSKGYEQDRRGACFTEPDSGLEEEPYQLSEFGSHTRCFVESRINSSLRHESEQVETVLHKTGIFAETLELTCDAGKYHPKSYSRVDLFNTSTPPEPDYSPNLIQFWLGRQFTCDNTFFYNTDYSTENEVVPFLPIDYLFDYCKECAGCHEYRYVWSEKSFSTDKSDKYLIYKANNYKDLPYNKGAIVSSSVFQDKLYIHTERSLWVQPTNPQEVLTNENTFILGTGEYMAIDPSEISSSKYGYAGTIDYTSTLVTEFGVHFVDRNAGKVFLVNSGIDELSDRGLRNFFEENLGNFASTDYCNAGGEPITCGPTSPAGVGSVSVYDPRHKRLIIANKDYNLSQGAKNAVSAGLLTFDNENGVWLFDGDPSSIPLEPLGTERLAKTGNVVTISNISNYPNLFINRSFTVSFSFLTNSWISFHSYLPNYMFNNQDTFYTSNNAGIWKHGYHNYQNYYGSKKDFIIDFIANEKSGYTKAFSSIELMHTSQLYDTDTKQFVDANVTFDRLIAYNDYQITSRKNLVPKLNNDPFASVDYTINGLLIDRVERNWRLNDIRNEALNNGEPLWSQNWLDLNTQYFIDRVVNPDVINPTILEYYADRFRDKYIGLKLFFKPINDYKLTLNLVKTKDRISFR